MRRERHAAVEIREASRKYRANGKGYGPRAGRPPRTRSHSAEHHAQIVRGHFGDDWNGESDGLRHCRNRFEVSQTPVRVVIAKAPVEGLIARRRFGPFAFVWTVEIERRSRREYGSRPFYQSHSRLPG